MYFKSIKDLSQDIHNYLLPKLPRDIGIVYGIPRSGMLPATIISTAIGAELAILGGNGNIGARGASIILPKGTKALIIDDSINKGRAMANAKPFIEKLKIPYYKCVVYANPLSLNQIDFYACLLNEQRIFQWNFSGIKATINFCWDMDGAICTNPKVFDDDGNLYREEILYNVKPLYLPQVKIKAIITNRIERWRPETEEWLKRYGVQYEYLIMQPFKTAVERRKKSLPEEFKARNFLLLKGTVFIESDEYQAKRIAEISKSPTLSIETMTLY